MSTTTLDNIGAAIIQFGTCSMQGAMLRDCYRYKELLRQVVDQCGPTITPKLLREINAAIETKTD